MASKSTKLPDDRKKVTKATLDHEGEIYRHKKRPEWGVAILAWEKGDRRAYQFEDGRLRKFKKGYYSLMTPAGDEVERPKEAVMSSLEEAIEANKGKARAKPLEPVASFEAQVELFKEMYPEGFQGEKWIEDHRGGSGRALKRHRDPVVEDMQQTMEAGRARQMLDEGKHGDLVDEVLDILAGTSLVALKHVKVLKAMDEDQRKRFAESVFDLLHGEDHFEKRYEAHLEMLTEIYDGPPSWRIATAIPAIMYPNEHVCVRRSAFKRQAAVIAPLGRYSRRAQVRSYKNFLRVANAVKQRLEAEGLKPRDLLDIHDFVWDTLRNAALDQLNSDED